jgi:hypothetical protein
MRAEQARAQSAGVVDGGQAAMHGCMPAQASGGGDRSGGGAGGGDERVRQAARSSAAATQ